MLINKDLLKVAKIASKDKTRPILNNIMINSEVIVATDMFKLLEIKLDKSENIDNFPIVPSSPSKACIPEAPLLINAQDILKNQKFFKNQNLPILENGLLNNLSDNTVSILTTDLSTAQNQNYRLNSGQFPDYTKIIPASLDNHRRVKLNPKLLIELLQAFSDFKEIDLYIGEQPTDAIYIEKENFRGLLMPLKS